ncbi:unnamed protein product, partial [marine sediment metagenome]
LYNQKKLKIREKEGDMTNKDMKHNAVKKNRIFSLIIYIAFSLLFILIVQTLPMYSATAIALASSGPS